MIFLTDFAAKKICEIAHETGEQPTVRARVIGGGCAGFSYDLAFDAQVSALDEVFDFTGAKIVIDPVSLTYMDGSTIDYVTMGLGEGFKVENPNSKGACGCGNSFSV